MAGGNLNDWLKQDSRFIKIRVGDAYACTFKSMRLDPTGGYEGKSTVRYTLQDIKDGKDREFSSSSKVLAEQMMTLVEGDQITIKGVLNKKEQKTYEMNITKRAHASEGVDPEPKNEGTDVEVPF